MLNGLYAPASGKVLRWSPKKPKRETSSAASAVNVERVHENVGHAPTPW